MKLLMIYADHFGYTIRNQTLDLAADVSENAVFTNIEVGFIQVEAEDTERVAYVETKLVKNLKWAARKNDTTSILLHSFAHLSDSKAEPMITKEILDNAEQRLQQAGYEVAQTPFGYFVDLDLKAPGLSLARVFKAI